MGDKFDLTYESTNEDVNCMDKELDDGKAYIQEDMQDDSELRQLVQELEKESLACKESSEDLVVQATEIAFSSGGPPAKLAKIALYDSHRDDLVIRGCATALNGRVHAFETTLEIIGKVKQQIEVVRGDLGKIWATCSNQVEQLRLEYEVRLDQQRRELQEQAQKTEHNLSNLLKRKRQNIDQDEIQAQSERDSHRLVLDQAHIKSVLKEELKEKLKTKMTAKWSSSLEVANATIAELHSKLASVEKAKKDSHRALAATQGDLASVTRRNEEVEEYALRVAAQKQELRRSITRSERDHNADVQRLNHKLREKSDEMQYTRRSLVRSEGRASIIEGQIDVYRSDYATLLTNVALIQKQKLSVARNQRTLLEDYLVKARSIVERLEATIDKIEGKDRRLAEARELLELKIKSTEIMKNQLKSAQTSLDQKNKSILAHQVTIRQVKETNAELRATLKVKDDLLKSKANQVSENEREIQELAEQAFSAKAEGRAQRSSLSQKDKDLCSLNNTNKAKDATIQQLHSDIDIRQRDLDVKASTIISQQIQIVDLETANLSLLDGKAKTTASMESLVANMTQLKLDLANTKNDLQSHSAQRKEF